jgi:thioredoxin 1
MPGGVKRRPAAPGHGGQTIRQRGRAALRLATAAQWLQPGATMITETVYLDEAHAPSRDEVDHMSGLVLLEFGTEWCGFCRALAPRVAALLERHPQVRHVKVEDGPGRPLGRSFRVKMWPNLVFLRDGAVVRQLARPSHEQLTEAFAALAQPAAGTVS